MTRARKAALAAALPLVAWAALTVGLQFLAEPGPTSALLHGDGGRTLVVLVHGLGGDRTLAPLTRHVRESYPDADLLVAHYDSRPFSNASAYDVANVLEARIHQAFQSRPYEQVIVVGHSMGWMIARKAILWAHGFEQDRPAPKGRRAWAQRLARAVSLAGLNRGWSIDPAPDRMRPLRYASIWLGGTVARLTGTGRLLLDLQRGAPFVADARVQWLSLTRNEAAYGRRAPLQTIHLLGDRDDIVSRADATDLGIARNTLFVTLTGTTHAGIVSDTDPATREQVRAAIVGDLAALAIDQTSPIRELPEVTRLVFVMHGIRDYGDWTDHVRSALERELGARDGSAAGLAIVNKKYGYFPMLSFLLYWDRQYNVRKFVDEYTECLARYPNVERIDFVGHSNGTYLLASALQRYRTVKVNRVYFAGSVVPKHYPWRQLLDAGRAEEVVNVVASKDWVVAVFPKLFEQVADWRGVQPTSGLLDLGAAGFRGFQAADDPLGRVTNVKFADGYHGVAVDTSREATLKAIVAFIADGDRASLEAMRTAAAVYGPLDVASNLAWLVWIALIALVGGLGVLVGRVHRVAGVAFWLVALGVVMSY
jgi:alpha-beta hydrolase superfamily lysophospholipase